MMDGKDSGDADYLAGAELVRLHGRIKSPPQDQGRRSSRSPRGRAIP